MELKLEIIEIVPEKRFTDKFTKSEIVGKTDTKYPDYFKIEFINDLAGLPRGYSVGDLVTVEAEVRGSKYEKDGKVSYFTKIVAKNIAKTFPSVADVKSTPVEAGDDLPF